MIRGLLLGLFIAPFAWAADLTALIADYDQASWQTSDKDARLAAFEAQLDQLDAMEQSAEVNMWQGAIKASVARDLGGRSALALLKESRNHLLEAQSGPSENMATAILANVLAKAPGWPLSVGNDKKAAELFNQALAANPDNIIALQGYGELLADKGDDAQARVHFEKALAVAPRAGREMADAARQVQIQALLNDL